MAIYHNDSLEISSFNIKYLDSKINPFVKRLIEFLIVILDNGDKGKDMYDKFNQYGHYLENNGDELLKRIKSLIPHGLLDEYRIRYSYAILDYQDKKNPISFHITKYKFIGDSLFVYDEILSQENRNYLEIKEINGVNIKELVSKLKDKGFNYDEIEVLLLHKEILCCFGDKSNKYELSVLCNGNIVNLLLDGDEKKIDFSIFAKEHKRALILEKNNFILFGTSNLSNVNHKLIYAHDSCLKLLAILHGMSKSNDDLDLMENIYTKMSNIFPLSEVSDKFIDWMFISSFFLLNKEEKVNLPEYVYARLEQKLNIFSNYRIDHESLDYEFIPFCVFLDENNNEMSFSFNVSKHRIGSNSYIWDDDLQKVNYRTLFHSLRNAFAHSSYEIIDENYIRIYGTDEEGKQNLNIKINKEIIVDFIDKLNNYSSFGGIFPICTLKEPNFSNKPITNKNELRKYLINLQISDILIKKYYDLDQLRKINGCKLPNENPLIYNEKCDFDYFEHDYEYMIEKIEAYIYNIIIIDQTDVENIVVRLLKKHMDCDFIKFTLSETQIKLIMEKIDLYNDVFYNQSATNQHIILTKLIKQELNPSQVLTDSLHELIKNEKKVAGTVMDSLNESSTKYINYSNIIKACVIAYLNSILLYSYNENNAIDCSNLDFSSMMINKNILISKKREAINNLKNENRNLFKEINRLKKYLSDLEKRFNFGKLDDEQKAAINKKINEVKNELSNFDNESLSKKRTLNSLEIDELQLELAKIESDEFDINEYILEHLRNALAHGNISFSYSIDINNIGDTELVFTDFNPRSGVETFSGSIKLSNLLTILTDEKYICSLYNINDIIY